MPLVLAGATSGSATVQATDATTVTLTLPATSGTLVSTGSVPAAGSTTQVQYNSSGVLAGSSSFVFDGTNVGIGTSSPASYGKLAVTGVSNLGVDQTDYIGIQGGGGTARIDTFGGNTNVNMALSTKGTGAFYIWRGGYGGTNTLLIDGSSNLQFNSGYGSVATAYGCRAWVSFNSDGSIRAGGNVSSVSVVNSSSYNVNLTTAMPDTNYSVQWTVNVETNHFAIINSTSQINCKSGGSFSIGYMAIFR